MGDINYAPVIQDMTWSYSRIKSFYDCPYKWYLRYIRKLEKKDLFFSSYGSFMHKMIEKYLKGEVDKRLLSELYLQQFRENVVGEAPNQKVFSGYFLNGLQYLKEIKPLPYNVIAVEKRVDFSLAGIPFVGWIDILGEKETKLAVIDNKSKNLKARSGRAKPTKTDEELDSYLIQLYLYSAAVEQEYGKKPESLCFNCFRQQTFIEEPFKEQAYAESKKWLSDKVEEITNETDFRPDIEYFKCRYLCEMQEHCEYYKLSQKR